MPNTHVDPTFVVAAGMPRSGSTWLYNVLRLTLLQHMNPEDLSCGWYQDLQKAPKSPCTLVKVHNLTDVSLQSGAYILYSYRDIRDCVASAVRRFGLEEPMTFARGVMMQDEGWRRLACLSLRYETVHASIDTRLTAIRQIAKSIGLEVDARVVDAAVVDMSEIKVSVDASYSKSSYDPVTLLHPGHITDGGYGTWDRTLSAEDGQRLTARYGDWLAQNCYV